MKFGKTINETIAEERALRKSRYNKRFKIFAWRPIRMADFTIAWLCYVYKDYGVFQTDYITRYNIRYYYEDLSRDTQNDNGDNEIR